MHQERGLHAHHGGGYADHLPAGPVVLELVARRNTIEQQRECPVRRTGTQQEIGRRVASLFALASRITARSAQTLQEKDPLTPSLRARTLKGGL